MKKNVEINPDLTAPINKGQVVGNATFTVYDKDYRIALVAENSIEEKSTFNIWSVISDILIILFRIIVILGILVIIIRIINKKRGKKMKLFFNHC